MRAAVWFLSLAVVALAADPGSIKIIHNGAYRARVVTIVSDTAEDETKSPITVQEIIPSDFKVHAPSNETAITATLADPYTTKLYDTSEKVVIHTMYSHAELSKEDIEASDWKELFFDSFRVNGTRCYLFGGTKDKPTWSVYTGKDVPGCSH